MSKTFWAGHSIKPPKPGLVKRQQELAQAEETLKNTPYNEHNAALFSGQSAERTSAEQGVRSASSALKRQQNVKP